MRVLRTPAIRAIEQPALAAGLPLMQRAGLAVAGVARDMLAGARHAPPRVLIVAGPGNNGGDGYEAGTHLVAAGMTVCLVTPAGARLPADAAAAAARYRAAGGTVSDALPDIEETDLVIDAMFGIGLARPLASPWADWIGLINAARVPVLAVDVPSGLDADTGHVHGTGVRATRTVTFIADKPGLHTHHGTDLAGEVVVASLDLRAPPREDADHGALLGREDFVSALEPRARNTHKGSFGSVGIIGGADGMTGAALLAGRAALKLGAGRVFIGFLGSSLGVDPAQPELMLRTAAQVLDASADALVVGPGLGQSDAAGAVLERAISAACPLLLDADALNLVAQQPKLAAALTRRKSGTVLTPHPLEAARLLGQGVETVQRDRIAAALALSRVHRAAVVVKGAGSVVAVDARRWWINTTGNPGMASGGMGDVLAGLVGALLARGVAPLAALQCGVHLHGAAADLLCGEGTGPVGLTAGETIDAARRLINRWIAG